MKISIDAWIPFSRPLVYATYRDKLLELVAYLPDVRQIEIKSQRQEAGRLYCINEWHGGGEIPAAARAVLSEDMLSWTEHNTWDETEFTLDWRIQTHAFTKAVHCAGNNRFIEDNGTTLIESRGELTINPNQIEGVPSFLAGGIASIVEDFLAQKIGPNLQQMSAGVRRYLEQSR
ncbi:MAG: hypothetical protein F6K19_11025 [Cyanothece sp. SIO1E1]|nr:hypothetical protein [Cyanothece sp. SIO1E1]